MTVAGTVTVKLFKNAWDAAAFEAAVGRVERHRQQHGALAVVEGEGLHLLRAVDDVGQLPELDRQAALAREESAKGSAELGAWRTHVKAAAR